MRVDHASGMTIHVPSGWQIFEDPAPEVAVVARAPADASGFCRNVTLTMGELSEEWRDPQVWQRDAAERLLSVLGDAQLIDFVVDEIDGDAFRQVFSYVSEGRVLVLEQWGRKWSGVGDGPGVVGTTLSATVPVLQYAEYAAEMAEIAGNVYPTGGETA